MEERLINGAIRIWQAVTGLVVTIGGLIYIGAKKEQSMNNEIKRLEEKVAKMESNEYVTLRALKTEQIICQQDISQKISDQMHDIILKYSESWHVVDGRLGSMEGDIKNICASLNELKKQKDLRLTP